MNLSRMFSAGMKKILFLPTHVWCACVSNAGEEAKENGSWFGYYWKRIHYFLFYFVLVVLGYWKRIYYLYFVLYWYVHTLETHR